MPFVSCSVHYFGYPSVQSRIKSVRIVFHAGGGPTNSHFPRNDGTAALEHGDLKTEHTQSEKRKVTKGSGNETVSVLQSSW